MVAQIVEKHQRNVAEKVTILAMIYRAGLYNKEHGSELFYVEPSTEYFDKSRKTDYAIWQKNRRLAVDITLSGGDYFIRNERFDDHRRRGKTKQRYQGFDNLNRKIRRSISRAQKGRPWIYIQRVSGNDAKFGPGLDPCFIRAWDQIKDGEKIALPQACPEHGNACTFAHKLFEFSERLNSALENENTEARFFAMPLKKPPF